MKRLLVIGIYIMFMSTIILVCKNKSSLIKDFEKIKKNNFYKYIKAFVAIVIVLYCFYVLSINVKKITKKYDFLIESMKNKDMFKECDSKIDEEWMCFKELSNSEKYSNNFKTPYIPDGFSYVEGDIETGYVIQDSANNQYVWIPCNKETLMKKNFSPQAVISYNYCYDESYELFLRSALENTGFYISRFEIGKENGVPVSKKNSTVWTDINIIEAKEIVNKMYSEEQINCELLNGFAYDTTLLWLLKNNNFAINEVNINNSIISGRNEINRVFDFTDNIFELTQEKDYDVFISRGYYGDDEIKMYSRYTILENDINYSDSVSKLTFRVMLYK